MSESLPERQHAMFSLARIWAISSNTFTQLARMKVFYFMLIFTALIIAVNFFFLGWTLEQELKSMKDAAFGAMRIFSAVFAIVGTALLIPKDVEDRTLYTILTKPVPRIEYLIGKLVGVLLLIAASLVMMSALFFGVLWLRQNQIYAEELLHQPNADPEALKAVIWEQGVRSELLLAVVGLFLQAAVAAGVALLVSTFASSTLFTIIVSLMVFLIGHAQGLAREFWFDPGEMHSVFMRMFSGLIAVVFPDFNLYVLYDGIAEGKGVPDGIMLKLVLLTGFYLSIHTLVSWIVFFKKEL
jgi:hypothetical protein